MVLIIMLVLVLGTILMFIFAGFWASIIVFISLVGIFIMLRLIFKMIWKMIHGTGNDGQWIEGQY